MFARQSFQRKAQAQLMTTTRRHFSAQSSSVIRPETVRAASILASWTGMFVLGNAYINSKLIGPIDPNEPVQETIQYFGPAPRAFIPSPIDLNQ